MCQNAKKYCEELDNNYCEMIGFLMKLIKTVEESTEVCDSVKVDTVKDIVAIMKMVDSGIQKNSMHIKSIAILEAMNKLEKVTQALPFLSRDTNIN